MVDSLARRGAHVTAIARDQERLNAMSGGQIDVIAGDATDPSFMENVVRNLSPNALVLNAGSPLSLGDIDALSFEAFSSNWNVNVRAALIGVQAALHAPLQQYSRVLLMSSGAAMVLGSPRIPNESLRLSRGSM